MDQTGNTGQQGKAGWADEVSLLTNILEHLPDFMYVKDAAGRYILDNEAHRRLLGVQTLREVEGKTVYDFFPKELADHYMADDVQVLRSGQPLINREEEITGRDGARRWVATTKVPLRDAEGRVIGLICRGRDLTEHKQAQDALERARDLLNALMDNVPDTIYFKDTGSRFTLVNQAQAKVLGLASPEEAIGKTDSDFFTPEHAAAALADEQRILASGEPLVGKVEQIRRADGEYRWVTATKVPMRDRAGKILGLVGISRDITQRKLAEEQVARYAAQMEADLKMARELQQALLTQQFPRFVTRAGESDCALQFCHRYEPSRLVGGDLFDVFALSETTAGVFVCDVMGKGVQAALVTAMVRALIDELKPQAGDPGRLLSDINRDLLGTLRQMRSPMFVSAFYLVADAATGRMCYASAGHPRPLHRRTGTGMVEPLQFAQDQCGPVLGMFEDVAYQSVEGRLSEGDLILLFTDGMFEVDGSGGEEYGQERLLAAVQHRRQLPAAKLLDEILAEVRQYSATKELADDACLLAMEVTRLGHHD